MRCLALRHLEHEGLGLLRAPLHDLGWDCLELDVRTPGDVPSRAAEPQTDLLIVLGGPMGVHQAAEIPILSRELEVLSKRLARGLPTLGICLGAQMMAAALGARVYRAAHVEVGWHRVLLRERAWADAIFPLLLTEEGLAGSGLTLHWHQDQFELPPGCVPLARSELCDQQAFRHGPYSYAVQFHPEVPAEDLALWTRLSHIPLQAAEAERIIHEGRRMKERMAARARAFMEALHRALVG
jgi:GMP synthase (glutamine-hydrolysing)